jgi:hypothetical protein
LPSTSTWEAGSTLSEAGATPNEQVMVAVDVTSGAAMAATLRGGRPSAGRVRNSGAREGSRPCPRGLPRRNQTLVAAS